MELEEKLNTLKRYCDEHGLRLTEPRRQVYEIIIKADKPIGAYDILDQLKALSGSAKPPTAYRALDFLKDHHFIHRIESLNAYMDCAAGHRHGGAQFMICDGCGQVEEMHLCHLPEKILQKIEADHFTMRYWNLEIHGRCQNCATK